MNNVLEYLEHAKNQYPDKEAVGDRDSSWSFSELFERTWRIGTALQKTGVSGKPVGVFAGQRIGTIAAFLSVVWAGGFYVPLDPDMPAEKLQSILDDCACPILIGTEADAGRLRELRFLGTFFDIDLLMETQPEISEDSSAAAGAADASSASGPAEPVWREDRDFSDIPLYMVYTSGSTGKPKGVLKSHGAEIDWVETYVKTFGFTADEVIGNQTPFFFDASGKDLYLMLKTGATLEILASQLFMMPTQLIEYMNEKKVTFASWVPSAISIVAQLNPFTYVKPAYLRRVFFVGEVMPIRHLNKWIEFLPDVQYVNLYGASELAGICCYYEVRRHFDAGEVLPIGRPLANCRVYLADYGDGMHLIKRPDVPGEIVIESRALALGYYHDADKTAHVFFLHDFGDGRGPVRCFRTGDIAAWNADGELVFSSRADFQIKHMGHRIELGEIETAADALPGIRKSACLYDRVQKKILLFAETEPGAYESGNSIRRLLKQKLSAYMVPGRVFILDRIPLNANGKTDRPALARLHEEKQADKKKH